MHAVNRAALGFLGVLPASAKVLSWWYEPATSCYGAVDDQSTFADGQFCGGLGICWTMPSSMEENMRYMKWVAQDNQLYAGFWSASQGGCGTWDDTTFLDFYSEEESQKLWAGECARGYFNGGSSYQYAKLDAACVASGSCPTCVKDGIKNIIQQDCKDGAKDAVKSVLQEHAATIGDIMVGAISEELDTLSLQDIGAQTVAEACTSCLDAVVDWLMQDSPSECTGAQSCSGADYMAGFAMQYMGISDTCSTVSNDEMSTAREGSVPACALGLVVVMCALVRW